MTVEAVPLRWDEVIRSIQADLAAMDDQVLTAVPRARVQAGSNGARAWALFCYRVYAPPPGIDIDPVVVGVNVSHPDAAGVIRVSGDVAGETLGDVLAEAPPRQVMGRSEAEEAARCLAAELARHAGVVIHALRDEARRA